jgi:predicted nucleic acid-binding protein
LKELRNLLKDRGHKVKYPPVTALNWYFDRVKLVEPAPLGKQRRRDAKDDPYLACALAAGAKNIVSRDDDLLALQKPFGIQILTPRELLTKLARPL